MPSGLASLERVARSVKARFAEVLTYSGDSQKYRGTVNWLPAGNNAKWEKGDGGKARPAFVSAGFTSIGILAEDMSVAPDVGQAFTDCKKRSHRIQTVQDTGFHWLCMCRVSNPGNV